MTEIIHKIEVISKILIHLEKEILVLLLISVIFKSFLGFLILNIRETKIFCNKFKRSKYG